MDAGRKRRAEGGGTSEERRREHGSNLVRLEKASELKKNVNPKP